MQKRTANAGCRYNYKGARNASFLRRSAGRGVWLPFAHTAAEGTATHAERGLLSETTDYVVANTTSSPPKALKGNFTLLPVQSLLLQAYSAYI